MMGLAQLLAFQPRGAEGLAFGLIAVVICALVFFIALRVLTSLLGSVGGMVSRLWNGAGAKTDGSRVRGLGALGGTRSCPNAHCRKANVRASRFCAQCGTKM